MQQMCRSIIVPILLFVQVAFFPPAILGQSPGPLTEEQIAQMRAKALAEANARLALHRELFQEILSQMESPNLEKFLDLVRVEMQKERPDSQFLGRIKGRIKGDISLYFSLLLSRPLSLLFHTISSHTLIKPYRITCNYLPYKDLAGGSSFRNITRFVPSISSSSPS